MKKVCKPQFNTWRDQLILQVEYLVNQKYKVEYFRVSTSFVGLNNVVCSWKIGDALDSIMAMTRIESGSGTVDEVGTEFRRPWNGRCKLKVAGKFNAIVAARFERLSNHRLHKDLGSFASGEVTDVIPSNLLSSLEMNRRRFFCEFNGLGNWVVWRAEIDFDSELRRVVLLLFKPARPSDHTGNNSGVFLARDPRIQSSYFWPESKFKITVLKLINNWYREGKHESLHSQSKVAEIAASKLWADCLSTSIRHRRSLC